MTMAIRDDRGRRAPVSKTLEIEDRADYHHDDTLEKRLGQELRPS